MRGEDLPRELSAGLSGTYRLERELGGGGMSRVFLAEETALGRRVVVKVLPPEMGAAVSVDRFRREVQLAARLQHPHIVPLLAAGEVAGALWYTMPFVAGETLRTRVTREGALPVGDVVRILREVGDALGYAHRQGVVHRDVKPENVLCADSHVLVADFGIAKALTAAATIGGSGSGLTTAGLVLGTPAYMAPEQAAGDLATDHRADIYALGCLGYELLIGRPPFAGTSAQALLVAHAVHAPEPPSSHRADVPAALEALVLRCLEKDPSRRPASAAAVVDLLEGLATGAHRTVATLPSTPGRPAPARWRGSGFARGAVAGAALLAAVAAAFVLIDGRQAHARSVPKSVAVLPFVNVGGDSLNEALADGMTDELIAALGRVPGLRVPGRTSTFAFKGRQSNAGEIARRLDVGTVLEGTVRRSGDRLRVTAVLVNPVDDFQLWSDTFDGSVADVFAVQDSIARAIAQALEVRLSGQRLAPGVTRDLAAYDLYQQATALLHQRGGRQRELPRSIALFEEAIARDSTYAGAWEGLALATVVAPEYVRGTSRDSAYARVRLAANRALALDSTRSGALAALGYMSFASEWDLRSADSLLRRAIAFNPGDGTARQWRAQVLTARGDLDEAIAEAHRALVLDPLAPIRSVWVGRILQVSGRVDSAEAVFRVALREHPGFWLLNRDRGITLLAAGRRREAVVDLERAAQNGRSAFVIGLLGYALAKSGQRVRAEQLCRELAPRYREVGGVGGLVYCYVGLGRPADAMAWARRYEAAPDFVGTFMFSDPILAPLRSEPGFADFKRRVLTS